MWMFGRQGRILGGRDGFQGFSKSRQDSDVWSRRKISHWPTMVFEKFRAFSRIFKDSEGLPRTPNDFQAFPRIPNDLPRFVCLVAKYSSPILSRIPRDFQGLSWIFKDFQGFAMIFKDFPKFACLGAKKYSPRSHKGAPMFQCLRAKLTNQSF